MKNISDHAHPMHKGPHHEKFVHPLNRMGASKEGSDGLQVKMSKEDGKELGDKSHIKSVMGEPKGADVAGHNGKMHW